MCRVSNLKLSCGTLPNEPHYRRADELIDHVRLTGTHMLPCLSRYLGTRDCCTKLDIDSKLPEGHLRGSVCKYCSVVQPAWNKALTDVLGKIELIFDDVWAEFRDDFRDPERQDHDEPLAMQKRIHDICSGALQAVVMWREEQPWIEFDDGRVVLDSDSLPPLSTGSRSNSDNEDDRPGSGDPKTSKVKSADHRASTRPSTASKSVKQSASHQPAQPFRQHHSSPDASKPKQELRLVAEKSTHLADRSPKALLSPKSKTPTKGHFSKHAVRGPSRDLACSEATNHHHDRFSKMRYELILRKQERRKKKLDARRNRLSKSSG